MQKTALKHGLVCLLYEKPFKGINGSGKHNNYSLVTSEGENLLNPGDKPEEKDKPVLRAGTLREVPPYPADNLRALRDPGHPAGRELYLQSLLREQGLYPDIWNRGRGKHILHRKEGKAGAVPSGRREGHER
jgi:hypothetical protein